MPRFWQFFTLGAAIGAVGLYALASTDVAAESNSEDAPPPAQPVNIVEPAETTTRITASQLTQGGWIRGQVPLSAASAKLGGQDIVFDEQGHFFAAFDRDAGQSVQLVVETADGTVQNELLSISPRAWDIEHVNVARRSSGPSAAFLERRRPELAQINSARNQNADASGWSEDFIWPTSGRISGRFGSQRVYRGEPGSYHSGLDIARPSGTPFVAPASGVVTLATSRPFSLEGYLLIIDHGQGLNSAFLHLSEIAVTEGDHVEQGQVLGRIGSSGRATGPHLHWSMKWRDARVDPLLFLGPMP